MKKMTLSPEEDKGLRLMIKALKESVGYRGRAMLERSDVLWLIDRAMSAFSKQPMLVELDGPVSICGDIHAQYSDLVRLLDQNGWPPRTRYLFLGDYVDRGPQNFETICLLFALKILYPDDVYLLRGNHETRSINRVYGFFDEMRQRCSVDMYNHFNNAFDWMPLSGLVAERILCMHGGISPDLIRLDQIREIARPLSVIPDSGLVTDLLWADPDHTINGYVPSNRGVSYQFGHDMVIRVCENLGLDLIVRAHQVVHEGYEFFADDHLVTVFSAPDYCEQFTNSGGILCVGTDLSVKLKQIPSKAAKARLG